MKRIIVGICLCIPILVAAGKITTYKALKEAINEGDTISLVYNVKKSNIKKFVSGFDFSKHVFNEILVKKDGNIIFARDYILTNTVGLCPIIKRLEYIVMPDSGVYLVDKVNSCLDSNTVSVYQAKAKLGNEVIAYSQSNKSNT